MIDLKQFRNSDDTDLMPALFVGHGSPMNAVENNEFSKRWQQTGKELPIPKVILCISAHWETKGTFVTATKYPETIYDFYGFPRELYETEYPAQGSPDLAELITLSNRTHRIEKDHNRGLDHGVWSVLKHMYPSANIPVIQLSIDYTKDFNRHYDLGKELFFLRQKGVFIIGSGNMVHNLRLLRIGAGGFNAEDAYDWAFELNMILKEKISTRNHQALTDFTNLTAYAHLGAPTFEHYIPLLYITALQNNNDKLSFFNDKVIAGSLSMTSFLIENL